MDAWVFLLLSNNKSHVNQANYYDCLSKIKLIHAKCR